MLRTVTACTVFNDMPSRLSNNSKMAEKMRILSSKMFHLFDCCIAIAYRHLRALVLDPNLKSLPANSPNFDAQQTHRDITNSALTWKRPFNIKYITRISCCAYLLTKPYCFITFHSYHHEVNCRLANIADRSAFNFQGGMNSTQCLSSRGKIFRVPLSPSYRGDESEVSISLWRDWTPVPSQLGGSEEMTG